MNKRKSILIALALILLSGAVFADKAIKQKVIWAPETLNLPSLKPGESTTTSVVLTNASVLNQKIEGEHLGFKVTNPNGATISATANFPKKIAPGQKVTVTLAISIASSTPALPPRVISGTVQLVKKDDDSEKKGEKDDGKEKAKLFEKPLLVNIAVSSIPLPPFPDTAANNATVLGIDIGGNPDGTPNGVRDDIDWYIATTMPDSEKARMGLTQYAKEDQKFVADFLATANDPVEQKRVTRENDVEGRKSSYCMQYTLGYIDRKKYDFNPDGTIVGDLGRKDEAALRNAFTVSDKLEAQFLNTTERQVVYGNADALLGGTGSGGEGWDARTLCKEFGFDPDLLPN